MFGDAPIVLPPKSLRFMNDGEDSIFWRKATSNLNLLRENGLERGTVLLDLGCGYGRLAYALLREELSLERYIGIDILRAQISWCRDNIQSRVSNYEFHHLNVFNSRYNKAGNISPKEVSFPVSDEIVDYCCLFSVFTHMFESDINAYLSEINRVLKPGGKIFCTFFVYDTDRLGILKNPRMGLPMNHRVNEHTIAHDPDDLLHAICYETSFVFKLLNRNGFQVKRHWYGTWAGGERSYQDVIVATRAP